MTIEELNKMTERLLVKPRKRGPARDARTPRDKDALSRAFTVHPGWAWAICAGVKKQEWRTFLPNPRKGTCAVHVSKTYGKAQWRRENGCVKEWWGVELPPYEELVENWCGKIIAVCDYEAAEGDWDTDAYGWRLTNLRLLKKRIPCKGALKLWRMSPELAAKVLSQIVG